MLILMPSMNMSEAAHIDQSPRLKRFDTYMKIQLYVQSRQISSDNSMSGRTGVCPVYNIQLFYGRLSAQRRDVLPMSDKMLTVRIWKP